MVAIPILFFKISPYSKMKVPPDHIKVWALLTFARVGGAEGRFVCWQNFSEPIYEHVLPADVKDQK